jgi:hypothetical protein
MFLQIDILHAQINDRRDGSVEILGHSGYIVVKAQYADAVKTKYKDFLKAFPQKADDPETMRSFVVDMIVDASLLMAVVRCAAVLLPY